MYYLFETLTLGEKRYIERKRMREPQRKYAKDHGWTFLELMKMEQDEGECHQIFLELWEECVVYMRRNNIKIKDLATQMGVCRTTIFYWTTGKKDYDKLYERLMNDKQRSRVLNEIL